MDNRDTIILLLALALATRKRAEALDEHNQALLQDLAAIFEDAAETLRGQKHD